MSPQQRKLNNRDTAALAEIVISDPRYRDALNAPFSDPIESLDMDTIAESKESAQQVIAEVIQETGMNTNPEVREWTAGKLAVRELLAGTALGSFTDYFLGRNSIPTLAEAEPELLPDGLREVVSVNSRIVRYAGTIEDPLEFIDTSLGIIERQRKNGADAIGPENYATTLKYFSDKYNTIERSKDEAAEDTLELPDVSEMKPLVDEALSGFFAIASRDAPNYLEMTNLYASIRALPRGVIDRKFVKDLLIHTTDNLDQYDKRVCGVLLSALSKIDTSEFPLETSAIVNLALNRIPQFERTHELRVGIRAIDSLRKNVQTEAAFERFLELSEGFSSPLDIEAVDEVMERMRHILDETVESTDLALKAKSFADTCLMRANRTARQLLAGGALTPPQLEQLKKTYTRIKENYQSL